MTETPLTKLRTKLSERHLDAFLVTNITNVQYLSGFSGDSTWLLITDTRAYLITDFRYIEQAHQETRGFQIVRHWKRMVPKLIELVRRSRAKRIGFEAGQISFATAKGIIKKLPKRARLRPAPGIIEGFRQIKTPEEISHIRKAIKIARDAFFQVKRSIKSGVTERAIAGRLDYTMQRLGAKEPGFPTIIAADERASLPHAQPTARPIRKPGRIQFDWGACYNFYRSDISRVIFLGKIPAFWRKIYDIVLEAQTRAIEKVRPGAVIAEIDKAARSFIASPGYGKNFGHGLGHGVGRAVHEGPSIGRKNKQTLKPGMVFTVEPGIYLPGKGGIRIEDMVLVTPTGCEILTRSIPKDISQMVIH